MSNNRQALSAMLPGLSDKVRRIHVPERRSSPSSSGRPTMTFGAYIVVAGRPAYRSVMALIDLNKELDKLNSAPSAPKPASHTQKGPDPYAAEASEKVLTALVLELLYDENSEVKNAAVAWWV